jgi:hypothetical protein
VTFGVCALGVFALYRTRYPQKYPQDPFAGKFGCNRIKHLRFAISRCRGAKSNRGPECEFELENECSIAYAKIAY